MRIGIKRVEGLYLCNLINDMPNKKLKDFKEKILASLLNLHNDFKIYYKNIKIDNILLPHSFLSQFAEFVVINLNKAIIWKYTLDKV